MVWVTTWTDDRIDRLKALHAEGYSCSQIAADLGDATRNAVIGKVNRLGLHRDRPAKKVAAPRAPRSRANKGHQHTVTRISRANGNSNALRMFETTVQEYKLRCVEIVPRNLTLMDLEPGDCRYAYGDGPMVFCGHPIKAGSSYCVPHHHLCWVPPVTQKARVFPRAA